MSFFLFCVMGYMIVKESMTTVCTFFIAFIRQNDDRGYVIAAIIIFYVS